VEQNENKVFALDLTFSWTDAKKLYKRKQTISKSYFSWLVCLFIYFVQKQQMTKEKIYMYRLYEMDNMERKGDRERERDCYTISLWLLIKTKN